jgi:hypothetical protein
MREGKEGRGRDRRGISKERREKSIGKMCGRGKAKEGERGWMKGRVGKRWRRGMRNYGDKFSSFPQKAEQHPSTFSLEIGS